MRAIIKIYIPLTKNCAQFLKNRTDEQKIARNNEKSHTAEYKYCAHPSTNAQPLNIMIFFLICQYSANDHFKCVCRFSQTVLVLERLYKDCIRRKRISLFFRVINTEYELVTIIREKTRRYYLIFCRCTYVYFYSRSRNNSGRRITVGSSDRRVGVLLTIECSSA